MCLDDLIPNPELHIGGHTVRRIDRGLGPRWECDCPEYTTIKPLSRKAWCEHCDYAVALKRGVERQGQPPGFSSRH